MSDKSERYDELREVYVELIHEHRRLKGENQTDYGEGKAAGVLESLARVEDLLNEWAEEDNE